MRKVLLVAGVGFAAVAALSACSSSSSNNASASATPSSASSASTSVLPPVIVADGATTATAKVGDTVVFNVADPVGTKIATTDTSVLEITQGYTDGSATFNPGGTALQTGTATVTVTEPGKPVRTVVVTIA